MSLQECINVQGFHLYIYLITHQWLLQNNLNYMICIRKESGFCSITYSTDNFGLQAMANEFNIVNFENEDSGEQKPNEFPTIFLCVNVH